MILSMMLLLLQQPLIPPTRAEFVDVIDYQKEAFQDKLAIPPAISKGITLCSKTNGKLYCNGISNI